MNHRFPLGMLTLSLALLLPARAWSADPALGANKFSQTCASCHSVASTSAVDRGRNSPTMIRNAISNIGAMGFLSALSTADLEDIAAYLGNSPAALSFSATAVGQTSISQVVTVRASRLAALGGLMSSVSGDYVLQGGTCGVALAAGSSCTVGVAFVPGAAGARSGSLSIRHDGISTPVSVALSGTGSAAVQPTLSLDASNIDFGNQTVGASSAARTVTLRNTGSAVLAFTAIGLTGAAAADFSLGGSCGVPSSLAAGASCSVDVRFTPASAGVRSATLTLASNASNGSASVALAGMGQAAATAAVSLSAVTLGFGSVAVGSSAPAQTVTLRNIGSAALNLQNIQASGPFTVAHGCGGSLAPAASCDINVVFTPTAVGSASGNLQVSSDAAGSPHVVSLSGSGVLAGMAVLQWGGATALNFGGVTVGAEAPTQTLTLSNAGTAAATIAGFALGGAQATDFRVDTRSTCAVGQVLAAGASCQLALGFTPSATGARTATVTVSSPSGSAPAMLSLTGTGSAPAAPSLSLSASALSFVAPAAGTAAAQILALSNTGNAELQVSALSLSSARFTVASAATQGCGGVPFTLVAGAACNLSLTWMGGPNDPIERSQFTVTSNSATAVVNLSGEGAAGPAATTNANAGGGGCTLGAGTSAADPTLLVLAVLAALLAWRRRRGAA